MQTLVKVSVLSCYPTNSSVKKPLPDRMAWLAPDAATSFNALQAELLKDFNVVLRVSDMYRSIEDQTRARAKYDEALRVWQAKGSSGPKPKFIAKPGYSFHQAGRAIDVDLASLKTLASADKDGNFLAAFWRIAAKHGWYPIIARPLAGKSESWHFDYPGSFKDLRARDYAAGANAAIKDVKIP